jgi:DNA-binding transcriptional ArsR family regulator
MSTSQQQTQTHAQSDASVADTAADEPSRLPLDTVFEILKNRRRRDILQYLWEHEGTANIGELAEHIAALENDIDVTALSSSQRKRVYIGLYQCHLPKMDDANVVAFDKHRGTVELRDTADELATYLDADEPEPTETPTTSLAAALAVGALVPLGALGVGPLGAVAPVWWALAAAVTLLAVTVAQVADRDLLDADSLAALRSRLASETAS